MWDWEMVLLVADGGIVAGELGGVGSAGAYPVGGGVPADSGDGSGRAAGADHDDAEGVDHVGAGDLRAGGRPDGSGSGDDVRASGRDDGAVAADLGAGDLPGGGPVGFDVSDAVAADLGRGALLLRARRAEGAAELQEPAGHHRDFGDGRAERGRQVDGGARSEDAEVFESAVPRGGGVHRVAREVRGLEGQRCRLPGEWLW